MPLSPNEIYYTVSCSHIYYWCTIKCWQADAMQTHSADCPWDLRCLADHQLLCPFPFPYQRLKMQFTLYSLTGDIFPLNKNSHAPFNLPLCKCLVFLKGYTLYFLTDCWFVFSKSFASQRAIIWTVTILLNNALIVAHLGSMVLFNIVRY